MINRRNFLKYGTAAAIGGAATLLGIEANNYLNQTFAPETVEEVNVSPLLSTSYVNLVDINSPTEEIADLQTCQSNVTFIPLFPAVLDRIFIRKYNIPEDSEVRAYVNFGDYNPNKETVDSDTLLDRIITPEEDWGFGVPTKKELEPTHEYLLSIFLTSESLNLNPQDKGEGGRLNEDPFTVEIGRKVTPYTNDFLGPSNLDLRILANPFKVPNRVNVASSTYSKQGQLVMYENKVGVPAINGVTSVEGIIQAELRIRHN